MFPVDFRFLAWSCEISIRYIIEGPSFYNGLPAKRGKPRDFISKEYVEQENWKNIYIDIFLPYCHILYGQENDSCLAIYFYRLHFLSFRLSRKFVLHFFILSHIDTRTRLEVYGSFTDIQKCLVGRLLSQSEIFLRTLWKSHHILLLLLQPCKTKVTIQLSPRLLRVLRRRFQNESLTTHTLRFFFL